MLTHLEHGLSWQFATAEGITQQLSGPRVKLPPPVLQENGHIDTEYFSVLAAKEGEVLPTVRRAFQKTMSVSASWCAFCNPPLALSYFLCP